MITQNGLADIFDDIKAAGQGIIDEGAAAIGIEKGGVIDKAATTAADVAKKVGVVPGNPSGNGYIDEKTMNAVDKFVNPGGKSTGTTSGGTSPANPGVQVRRTSNNTGTTTETTIMPSNGVLEKVNPLVTGTAVAAVTFLISRRLALSAMVGTGALLAQQAYKFNRS